MQTITKILIPALLLIFLASFSGCSKPNNNSDLCKTWVLVEKEINGINTTLPEDDKYPVILTFLHNNSFSGKCDANTYEGNCVIKLDNVLLSIISSTDCFGTEWYWDYLYQLHNIKKFVLTDTDNLQLLNENNTTILYFLSKEKFEEDYFELKYVYNF